MNIKHCGSLCQCRFLFSAVRSAIRRVVYNAFINKGDKLRHAQRCYIIAILRDAIAQ